MKKIQSVTIWQNGESKNANILQVYINFDDLIGSCSFLYQLCSSNEENEDFLLTINQTLANGEIKMIGDDYLEWDGSNEQAYTYIANKLNLTIL
jgi:hypothetical protein